MSFNKEIRIFLQRKEEKQFLLYIMLRSNKSKSKLLHEFTFLTSLDLSQNILFLRLKFLLTIEQKKLILLYM